MDTIFQRLRLADFGHILVARSYFLPKMAYRKMPPFRAKWLTYGDTESRRDDDSFPADSRAFGYR